MRLESSPTKAALPRETISLFDVDVTDVTLEDAAAIIDLYCQQAGFTSNAVFFVNAHTLNLANRSQPFKSVLREAHTVFGDGTGVRLAARWLRGVRLKANVNGTDLLPFYLSQSTHGSRSCFLLGAAPDVISCSAESAAEMFPHWNFAGYQHGFFGADEEDQIINRINALKPNLLLVGMGNPQQELWIHRHLNRLNVGCCIGVGALLDYWAGKEVRSPEWMQRTGLEWLYRMFLQKGKFQRYALGVPEFIVNVLRAPR
ncbi:MAG: glycosyltransferase [Deltaproteobacteria bacterium]|nr:glycosyltransferase [Deltaproteobacteria bacterium]